jgi:membrane carboxypeptidase/penicillin-binding protein PbpC
VTENNIKTIDARLQKYTKEVIKETLNELKLKNVTNASVFAIIPKTKEILIYQGSKDFYALDIDGQVDVIKSKRQP